MCHALFAFLGVSGVGERMLTFLITAPDQDADALGWTFGP